MDLLPPKFMSLVFFFQTLSVTLFLLKSFGGCVSFKLCLYFRRQTLVFSCSWRRSTTVARAKRMRVLFLLQKVIKRMSFYFFPKRYLFVLFDQKNTKTRKHLSCVFVFIYPHFSRSSKTSWNRVSRHRQGPLVERRCVADDDGGDGDIYIL